MNRFRAFSIVAVFLICTPVIPGAAQSKRPMTLIDLLETPSLSDPQLSPDGKQALYVLGKADWKANNRANHIWRIQIDGTGVLQMTNGPNGENSPRWSPDGARIAFLRRSARTGEAAEEITQIQLIGNSGGESRQLTKHATSVSSITWAPSGDAIYFLASEPKSAEEKERDKQKDDVYTFEQNFKQTHLWKIDLKDEKEKRITEGDYSVMSYSLSQDGTRIAFLRALTPLYGDQDLSEVFVMNSAGGDQVRITSNNVAESDARLSPDNSQVLFIAAANRNFESYFNNNLFVAPAGGGNARLLIPDFPYEVNAAGWANDGRSIYLVTNMGAHSELQQLDLGTLKVKQLTSGDHAIGNWTLSPTGDRQIFTIAEPENPGEAYIFTLGGAAPARVTRVFEYLTRDFKLPQAERVQWKGADGADIEGILTYPLDYQPGTRYPLVVSTHGGPASSDKMGFGSTSLYKPVLAAKGYAILQPNYRGSTGYGNACLRDMVGHYFNQAHLDVMTGVDYLIQRSLADPERMVKMGWSAGGHMTNKIITFTERFKAAASGAGAANWVSMYAQSDVRTYRTPWFGGTPWQKDAPLGVYWENSPLKDAWKVKTPTLFLVGERDVRVPMPQSVEMYRALKSNGISTKLCVAPREPHGWGELRHQLYKMNVELDWFETYATKRPYTWEKAPADSADKAAER